MKRYLAETLLMVVLGTIAGAFVLASHSWFAAGAVAATSLAWLIDLLLQERKP